jgi:hypothetical protein
MRAAAALVTFCTLLGGCAGYPERQSLGYGDYVAFSCEQLGQEAVRLMRETRNRSEHLLGNDQDRRATAMAELKAVKQASAAKQC